ncbi:MAG: type IX secretion system sortase PorU [Bacteroidia bacterium]|nr:type IX secretion system sortase PorU [Bacteroidia bacterium]
MKLLKYLGTVLFLSFGIIRAQSPYFINNAVNDKSKLSAIVKTSAADSSFIKVELKNAFYDFTKKQFPYYQVSKSTPANQSALASLVINSTQIVPEKHASVIKRLYAPYLTGNFELNPIASMAKGENLNRHRLIPFRINSYNQLEELIDYSINWQIVSNPVASNQKKAGTFKNSSVLASGNWYKIGVTRNGAYKMDKTFFEQLGINTTTLNPQNIRVYGNGGKMVPERNKDFRYDDLEENAIIVNGEADGVFNNADYVVFYGTGTAEWRRGAATNGLRFEATSSLYSDTSFYFINVDLGRGKRAANLLSSTQPFNVSTSTYDYYNFHELNQSNFGKSGREFFGEYFDITTSYNFKWDEGDFVVNDSLISQVTVASRYSDSVRFSVNCGNLTYNFATRGLDLNQTHEDYAAPGGRTGIGLTTDAAQLLLTVTKTTPKSLGWLNKVTVNARRNLMLNGKQFAFRDRKICGNGKVCKFIIQNNSNSLPLILNVSDPINPVIQEFSQNGQVIDFKANADSLNEYCVIPQNDYYVPDYTGKVPNQNLHGKLQADFVIITHPLFLEEAERLGAFHQQMDGLSYVVASIDQIYNEFGSGKQDPAAIRDFIRMLYSRNLASGKQVKYVALMGDGSYNNKSRNLLNNSNFIPTYQSVESLSETSSVATDDFYGLMDDNEGAAAENYGAIDIGIGRFTCRSKNEVKVVLDKIANYYKKDPDFKPGDDSGLGGTSVMGDWRNWLIFLGDDEDEGLHMSQSDQLSGIVSGVAPSCNIDKIFLDAYQRYSTAGGLRYPDATIDFLKRIKKGALVFNYTGHGGEVGLTAERMIDIDIINGMDNFNRLPLFITATCEFSRYDDPARTSAGELCLLNSKGGAIALFTTCRLAFASSNFSLNSVLLQKLFARLPNGRRPALGDILRETKAIVGQSSLANFHLLGDPALVLAYPEEKVITSKINSNVVTSSSSDTLGALSKITISGYVADNSGVKISNFNGVVYPTVFDKVSKISCLMNSESSAINFPPPNDTTPLYPFQFNLQKNILYRGKIQVTNGDFTFSFLVPKDISFSPGPGRISYYATNGLTDANGYYTKLVVGGTSKNVITDNEGPKVELYLNDRNYVNGSVTNESPLFHAIVSDSSGINTVGTGIGHDISIILDQNTSKPVILNDYYEADLNTYQSGKIRYAFNELSEGNHSLSFKVWDIQNNSSVAVTDFVVAKSANVALEHVLNYPNPFTSHTKFMFQHNQGCQPLKVTVQIYTVSGKIVKTLQKAVSCDESGPQGVEWDGKDDYGDKLGRGVYIYKLAIIDPQNKKAEKIEKLVILN